MKKLILLLVLAFIIQTISFSQPCLPQGITFSTQEEIDNFQTNNPNCTEIEGSIMISGADITNLNGLSVLTSCWENFQIGKVIYGGNPVLTSLTGLENLTSIQGSLYIQGNYVLNNLTGLEGLNSVGGLHIHTNGNINSLTGLENLESIGGDLLITYEDNLSNFVGLEGLISISGVLDIYANNQLTSLEGLENLISIGSRLSIGNHGWMFGLGNPVLADISSLGNLTSIGGALELYDNDALTSLTGLENIDAGTISNLVIAFHYSLSNCAIESICNYLANPNGTIEIYDNATGCNSQQEVEEACEVLAVNENILIFDITIYPNPATNRILITSNNGLKIESVNIYNQLGQKVLHINEIRENIDISTLGQGIYIIELTSGELKFRQKLIIEK